MESLFLKKHDNSIADQESLVTQIKSQLMKLHFQSNFQGDSSKNKRLRNKGDSQTMKVNG